MGDGIARAWFRTTDATPPKSPALGFAGVSRVLLASAMRQRSVVSYLTLAGVFAMVGGCSALFGEADSTRSVETGADASDANDDGGHEASILMAPDASHLDVRSDVAPEVSVAEAGVDATDAKVDGTVDASVDAAAPPAITWVTPSRAVTTGGTTITISGSNFITGATVTIAGLPATSINVTSTMTISTVTPASLGSAGLVSVRVTNPDTQFANNASVLSYYPATFSLGQPQTYVPVPTGLQGVVLADMNHDTKLDLTLSDDQFAAFYVGLATEMAPSEMRARSAACPRPVNLLQRPTSTATATSTSS